jgi:hypothetical protein
MKRRNLIMIAAMVIIVLSSGTTAFTAYNHGGDTDSVNFRTVYPEEIGTKLDSCALCHTGGQYNTNTYYGSCQWCHYVTSYGADSTPANLLKTLNAYGLDYLNNGRDVNALVAIRNFDSDGDNYTNETEIAAGTYPGDKTDDPSKVPAPSIVLSIEELEKMVQHTQFLLMNTTKDASGDFYTEYDGIALENLIRALMLDSATGITVYAPDGFATYHPFSANPNPNIYHVFGIYPSSIFYYDTQADMATNPSTGWCNYSSPAAANRGNGDPIFNPDDLKMMLAFERDGEYLTPGVLNSANKLDGEGPFRVVPPQKNPGPPDQRSTAANATNPAVWIWPYSTSNDHNAGFSSRAVTMIRVEPLPLGTTDVKEIEAAWSYIDEKKIIIYGAINPSPVDNLNKSLDSLITAIKSLKISAFKNKLHQATLVNKIEAIKNQVAAGAYSGALSKLKNDVLQKMNGYLSGAVDANDWVSDLNAQKQLVFQIQTISIMLVILGG